MGRQALPRAAAFAGRKRERPRPRGGRGLRIIGRSRRPSERSQGGGRPQSLPAPYAGVDRVRQSSDRQRSYAFSGRPKKRLHPKMEPYESGANGRGRRKRRLPMGPAEGGGSAQTRVAKRVDRGRRCSRASQRQSEYADGQTFPQWKGLHHSHAFCAGKVSLFDPIMTVPAHSSRRQ